MAKVNISINDDLLNEIDTLADDMYISRSGFIAQALVTYLNNQKMVSAVQNVSKCFSYIVEHNEIDDESLAVLKSFERLVKMM